jgi:hypothetical protein
MERSPSGISQVDDTVHYINTQKEHHAKMGFDEEFRGFLEKHGISSEHFSRPLRGLARAITNSRR